MKFIVIPQIDRDRCDGCGLCVSICCHQCLVLEGSIVIIVENADCDWCTQCEAVCINEAITCPYEIIIG